MSSTKIASVTIASENYNGKTVVVTFYSASNPSVGINLGTFTVPFTRYGDDLWGTYEIFIPEYNKVCQHVVSPNVPGLISISGEIFRSINNNIIYII